MHLIEHLESCIALARADSEFLNATKGLEYGLVLEVLGRDQSRAMEVTGRSEAIPITLSAKVETWEKIVRKAPPVGYHSFTAVSRQPKEFFVSGEPIQVAQSLHAVERLFEILRGQLEDALPLALPDLENIQGRYARINLPNAGTANLYYECSGKTGAPALVMLHTAGADSRQYHHILADAELQKKWRMLAFDMPSHGRSMPIAGTAWQGYRLGKQLYGLVCDEFIRQVVGKSAVLLGCSMGAAMALRMAAAFPQDVAGVVALEAPFRAVGRRTGLLAHPAVNQTAHNPSYVRGLMSPLSPLDGRRNAAWIYSQGGFQVYSGDLAFYSEEFDAETDLAGVDGNRIGVSLLTGSYDYSATPADSQKVADMIFGARFTVMPDLGHFPMIENPASFLEYLRPELDYVLAKLSPGSAVDACASSGQ